MDTRHYDDFVNKRAKLAHEMLTDRNAATRKDQGRDTRGLEVISKGLGDIRAAGAAEHIDRWADAAWQLALQMFGGN